MKYRKLHREELEEVRDEFIQFLAANTVTADDWENLKKTDADKAETLIEMFSDIFWDKALTNIQCVELREAKRLRVVRFDENEAKLIELRLGAQSTLDLTNPQDIQQLASGTAAIEDNAPEMYRGNREYAHERNAELFNFIEQGARPCKLVVWEGLRRMIND